MLACDEVDAMNGQFVDSESCVATYATLTPLQPPSPLSSTDSGYGSSINIELFDTNFTVCSGSDDLSNYNFLEPLMPTAMVDGTDTVEPCSLISSLSVMSPFTLHGSSWLNTADSSLIALSTTTTTTLSSLAGANHSSSPSLPDTYCQDLTPGHRDLCPVTSTDRCRESHPMPVYPVCDLSPVALDFDDELDTREIAERVSNELKRFNISQVQFAQSILGRSQGTLSDLLRNPKPWEKLKSGRETFARMRQWLEEPERQKLAALNMAGSTTELSRPQYSTTQSSGGLSRSSQQHSRTRTSSSSNMSSAEQKHRMVFTEFQRRTLQRTFREDPRPNRDTQIYLSKELGLPLRTVCNFFMNARRRSHSRCTTLL